MLFKIEASALAAVDILGISFRITITFDVTIANILNHPSGCGRTWHGKRRLPAGNADLLSLNPSREMV